MSATDRLRDRLQTFVRDRFDDLTWQQVELFDEIDLALICADHGKCDEQIAEIQDELCEMEVELDKALAKLAEKAVSP